MRRIEVEVPEEIEKYFSNKKISKIIKGHRSGDLVYRIGNEYILKISRDIESLNKEMKANDSLFDKVKVSKTVEFVIYNSYAFYLKTMVKGKNLISSEYLNNPNLLVNILVKALNMFHSIDINGCNIYNSESSGEVYVHGDFCLPNIIVDKNGEIGFIDTQTSGLGDPWIDYAWCIWSLEYNLKTKEYTPLLLKKLGIEFNKEKYNLYISE